MTANDLMKLSKQERTAYLKKKYPFTYYRGFLMGLINSLFLDIKKMFSNLTKEPN